MRNLVLRCVVEAGDLIVNTVLGALVTQSPNVAHFALFCGFPANLASFQLLDAIVFKMGMQ